jgi:hypothetical protein
MINDCGKFDAPVITQGSMSPYQGCPGAAPQRIRRLLDLRQIEHSESGVSSVWKRSRFLLTKKWRSFPVAQISLGEKPTNLAISCGMLKHCANRSLITAYGLQRESPLRLRPRVFCRNQSVLRKVEFQCRFVALVHSREKQADTVAHTANRILLADNEPESRSSNSSACAHLTLGSRKKMLFATCCVRISATMTSLLL